MFSNDRNIETIAQLIEVLRHYIGLQSEYVRLDVIEKVVRLLTVITVVAVFCIIVGGGYLLLLVIFISLRHRLIERPLVRFLGSLLMSK